MKLDSWAWGPNKLSSPVSWSLKYTNCVLYRGVRSCLVPVLWEVLNAPLFPLIPDHLKSKLVMLIIAFSNCQLDLSIDYVILIKQQAKKKKEKKRRILIS